MQPCGTVSCLTFQFFVFFVNFQSVTRLLTCLLRDETQVSTIWLQCTILYCLVWGLGSTLTSEGRKTFDVFFRKTILGENKQNPKSKSFKLSKNQIFPDRSIIFDWVYDKRNNGSWVTWSDTVEKVQQIPPNAKVIYLGQSAWS